MQHIGFLHLTPLSVRLEIETSIVVCYQCLRTMLEALGAFSSGQGIIDSFHWTAKSHFQCT